MENIAGFLPIIILTIIVLIYITRVKKSQPANVETTVLKTIHYCRNCGKKVSQGQPICNGCGFKTIDGFNYCQQCGEETKENQAMCVKCGFKLLNQTSKSSRSSDDDNPDTGIAILSFLLPIVGLILYIVWKDTKPRKAASAGKGALFGFIVGFLFGVIIFSSI